MNGSAHDSITPSDWVVRWADRVPAGGRVLDVACGKGRNARLFAARGHPVEAVDRDPAVLSSLSGVANVTARCADLERGAWPYDGERFAGVVVTRYLWRPLFPKILAILEPGGVLIYETFELGNERFGRPSNPEFLLRPGELLEVVRGRLRVIAYEDVCVSDSNPALVQRICAVNSS